MEHAFIFITQVCWNVFLHFLLSRRSWQQGTNNQATKVTLCGSLVQPFPVLPPHCCQHVYSCCHYSWLSSFALGLIPLPTHIYTPKLGQGLMSLMRLFSKMVKFTVYQKQERVVMFIENLASSQQDLSVI